MSCLLIAILYVDVQATPVEEICWHRSAHDQPVEEICWHRSVTVLELMQKKVEAEGENGNVMHFLRFLIMRASSSSDTRNICNYTGCDFDHVCHVCNSFGLEF